LETRQASDAGLFANPETGRRSRIQENWLVPAAQKAGIGRIRHSTLLHALGVDLKVQQKYLRDLATA
jgi:hypothetical protein